jgi:hypothetical protein
VTLKARCCIEIPDYQIHTMGKKEKKAEKEAAAAVVAEEKAVVKVKIFKNCLDSICESH